jgi:murein DD-endopeptidase MepM/ murein hydrolase activator NlpD
MTSDAKNLPHPAAPAPPPIDYGQPAPPLTEHAATAPPSPASRQPVGTAERKGNGPAGEADRIAPEGAPLHLAMPIAGVDPHKLTDTFAETRNGHKHEALDIPAPRGTPILAVAEGNVAKLFHSQQGGLTVYQFDDSRNYCFYYAHLDRYAAGLKEGTLLRKGDVVGYVGTTGDAPANAPHLHLAVFKLAPDKKWWNGTPIDPLPLLR